MKIYAVVLTDVATPDEPYLVDAWDAAMVEANPAGWRSSIADEARGEDVHAIAGVVIEVPTAAVLEVLRAAPPRLAGEVAVSDQG